MAKKEQDHNPQPDFVGDEHWGKGGRFVVDPKTGKRIPAEQYKPAQVNKSLQLNKPDEVSNGD